MIQVNFRNKLPVNPEVLPDYYIDSEKEEFIIRFPNEEYREPHCAQVRGYLFHDTDSFSSTREFYDDLCSGLVVICHNDETGEDRYYCHVPHLCKVKKDKPLRPLEKHPIQGHQIAPNQIYDDESFYAIPCWVINSVFFPGWQLLHRDKDAFLIGANKGIFCHAHQQFAIQVEFKSKWSGALRTKDWEKIVPYVTPGTTVWIYRLKPEGFCFDHPVLVTVTDGITGRYLMKAIMESREAIDYRSIHFCKGSTSFGVPREIVVQFKREKTARRRNAKLIFSPNGTKLEADNISLDLPNHIASEGLPEEGIILPAREMLFLSQYFKRWGCRFETQSGEETVRTTGCLPNSALWATIYVTKQET